MTFCKIVSIGWSVDVWYDLALKLVAELANNFSLLLTNCLISEKKCWISQYLLNHSPLFGHPPQHPPIGGCCGGWPQRSDTRIEHIKLKVCNDRNNGWADIVLIRLSDPRAESDLHAADARY